MMYLRSPVFFEPYKNSLALLWTLLFVLVFVFTLEGCEDSKRQREQALKDDLACPRKPEDPIYLQGERLFQRTCSTCHKMTGDGQLGAFPPIRRHAGRLAASADGRGYLVRLLLWGQRGPLMAENMSYNNVMPPQATGLTDQEILAVLSYATYAFGNCRHTAGHGVFTTSEVASARAESAAVGRAKMTTLRAQATKAATKEAP